MKIRSLKDATQFASEVKETPTIKYVGIIDTPRFKSRSWYGYDDEKGYFLVSSQGRTYMKLENFIFVVYQLRKEINKGGWESDFILKT